MTRTPRRRARRKLAAILTIALFLPGATGAPPAAANPLPPVEPDFRTVADGNSRFAFDLYDRLKTSEGNVVFSPYSVSTALAMTYAGARTETAEQMARVLQFELPPSRLHAAFATLRHALEGVEKDVAAEITLDVANRLWGAPDEEFLDEFLQTIRTHYAGGFETLPSDYGETGELQILELPYEGKRLSMVVLLPKQRDGLESVEASLTPGLLEKWMKELRPHQVAVGLPRFRAEYRTLLEQELAAMGMPLAFSTGADFSGMDGRSPSNLFIHRVIHQALVEVTETGTEAAASTAVTMLRASEITGPQTVFRADHPFLFLIRDRATDTVLFLGRVTNPGEIDV